MHYRTPWDDLDIDPVVSSSQIPRLKLPTPGFYFALLPLDPHPRDSETRWQNATDAHEMRLITARCLDYERRLLSKIAAYQLKDSSSILTAIETQQKLKEDLESTAMTLAASVIDLNQQSRKRGRATKPETVTPPRRSKRIRFARDKKNGSAASSPPPVPPAVQVPLNETTIMNIAFDETSSSKETSVKSQKSPKFNPFNNPSPLGNIVNIHQKIYCAVDTWHDLILQAEAVEHNLLAMQSQADVTNSSIRQSDMSKDELEELHAEIQNSATEVLSELDAAAMTAFSSLGFRSSPMSAFRASDPRKKEMLSYEFELEWQMRELGLFAWWLYHFNESLQ